MRDVLPPGTLLDGKYRIDYALGRGGFGITYRAQHVKLEQLVAIKEFYPQEYAHREGTTGRLTVAKTQQDPYQRGLERFLKEGKILAKLNHQNVVRVQDFFEERETAYLVMELLTGHSLRDELNEQPGKRLPPKQVVSVMDSLVGALEAVHKEGIYHLDLKPDNVLLTPEGRVVLVDFGAAKQGLGSRSTQAYTPGYAPLELMAGQQAGPSSDIFELGVMVYEMLIGKLPEWLNESWKPSGLEEPWGSLVASALKLHKEERPNSVRMWWQSKPGTEKVEPRRVEEPAKPSPEKRPVSPEIKGFPPLQVFEFEVVTVNAQAEIIKRQRQQAQYYTESLPGGVSLEMVYIPGGKFLMGSPAGEGSDDEKPQHQVTVPPFFMGKYPVTQKQWRAVASLPKVERDLNPDPSNFKGDDRPVEKVNWYDAVEFCKRLSKKTGREYRLPSEAEWEYACRAGTTTKFYFGETLTPKLARCKANFGMVLITLFSGETTPVGQFPPNAFGLYDLHGNVWEWCADTWHDNYVGAPTDGSAWTTGGNDNRSPMRGGSWGNNPLNCRSAYRNDYVSGRVNLGINFGFRVGCGSGRTL
jgi:formylglycine-generating enzyme required for sulfatase activity/predicted Ser/Thr protein kinase